ncbi:metal ABC transporter permease [Dechloromonas sp. ZY10]|uniref:metal ABC transporter permease n=1 Tax=Dechloromonas aquae TaxID=2664436 RepID=UPI0035276C27
MQWTSPDFALFALPFANGLLLALLLPLLGAYLRLRDEWLAALAYAHVAAAGALLAASAALPPVAGGLAASAVAGAGKQALQRRLSGAAAQVFLLLASWALAVLLVANNPLAESLGHALFDGQLYFAGWQQLALAGGALLLTLLGLRRWSADLLLARLYPDFLRLRGRPAWPVLAGFDLLAALCLALATMTLGVMGAFALVFIPAWLAFRRAASWRRGLLLALACGLLAYLAAFALALGLDQPFGPVLALLLLLAVVLG